jgi:hypothetical protein
MPRVIVQVLPAVAHPVNASGFLLADDAAWVEHTVSGYVFTGHKTVTGLALRFEYDYFCWLGEDDAPAPASYATSGTSRLTPEPQLSPCARAPLRTRFRRVGRPSLAINPSSYHF